MPSHGVVKSHTKAQGQVLQFSGQTDSGYVTKSPASKIFVRHSVLPLRNRDSRLLTGITNPAVSSGNPLQRCSSLAPGPPLRDTTKELRHDSTMLTLSWGKVSLALAVVLPRDFQWFTLGKKRTTSKKVITVVSLSPSCSFVLQILEFVMIFCILPAGYQLTQLSKGFPAR